VVLTFLGLISRSKAGETWVFGVLFGQAGVVLLGLVQSHGVPEDRGFFSVCCFFSVGYRCASG
jgi:hypothetical protein